jgi:small-conductance mechanosensitive channel
MFLFILLVVVILSRLFARKFLERILIRLQIEEGTRYTFRRIIELTLILIGAIIAFQSIGINLSGLAVIFGLLSVGIGFGLQNITSNFVAGLILLFERPIKVGDRVTVGGVEGDVMDINIRSTTVRSLNNIAIIVPNSEFVSSQVVNWSHGDRKIRLDIEVGVSYQSDLDTVLRSLKEVALENPEILRDPEPDVHLREFGDSSWNMKLRIWIDNPKRHPVVRSEINCAIVRKFRENGVEIPFPQRDFHLRSPLPTPLLVTQGVEQRAV